MEDPVSEPVEARRWVGNRLDRDCHGGVDLVIDSDGRGDCEGVLLVLSLVDCVAACTGLDGRRLDVGW